MKNFKVTYLNSQTGQTNSVVVKARSLESAYAQEMSMFLRMLSLRKELELVSVQVAS